MKPVPLPLDSFIPDIASALRRCRAVVVTAAPGTGKTTRVPPALVGDGRVLVLQPRRVAARAIARRIAEERNWVLGRDVGWHVRFERNFERDTPLVIATEGILTARLQQDPLLEDVRTIVIDEFHERSIHADLGLAFARQAWRARDDLNLVVMSATMDASRVAAFLDDCPIVDVPGESFPVEIEYRPGVEVEEAVADVFGTSDAAVLAFLPGAPEIRRAAERLRERLPDVPVLPLHGGLAAEEQDRAVRGSRDRRVVLATNLAETTLTVPDVRVVVDSGLHKVARYDASRGIDSLDLERISADSAIQRAGRAGRTARGLAVRLWDRRDRLRQHRDPDIARVDLASAVMDVIAWGGEPRSFEWFERPDGDAIEAALVLLRQLGAVDRDGLTPTGQSLRGFPLHPRLAALVHAGRGAPLVVRAAALLAERGLDRQSGETTDSDLLAAIEDARALPAHVVSVAEHLRKLAARALGSSLRETITPHEFRRAVLAAYPDRIARRRAPGADGFLLASGAGARLSRASGVTRADWIVAVDVSANAVVADSGTRLALIRAASAIDPEWVEPTSSTVEHTIDAEGRVRAARVDRVGAIELRRVSVPVDPEAAESLVVDALLRAGPSAADRVLLARLGVAGAPTTFVDLVKEAARHAVRVSAVQLSAGIPPKVRQSLDRLAPPDLELPSGRRVRLDYRDDGRIIAAVRLQEVFGLADTPRIGPSRLPVTFELLSPAGRPVQVTADLRSFWTNGYPEVRKELRARYPKHAWPEEPWTAQPTRHPKRRGS